MRRKQIVKYVINGKPVEKEGQVYDYKMMLVEHARRNASMEDLEELMQLLNRARKCMGLSM